MTTLGAHWGDRVAARRSTCSFTQQQLADLCDVKQQTISKIESGDMIPSDQLKVTISRMLLTEPSVLFEWPALKSLAVAS